MFLSNLEEHHVVTGTRLCITFRQTKLNSRYAGKKANKTNKNKRARHNKQTKTTKKAPWTPKTNHLRKINCTSFVNYFYSPCSTEPPYMNHYIWNLRSFHLCVLLVHTMGFMRKSVHPQDSLFMKYEGGPEDFIWSGYGSLTTSEVLM